MQTPSDEVLSQTSESVFIEWLCIRISRASVLAPRALSAMMASLSPGDLTSPNPVRLPLGNKDSATCVRCQESSHSQQIEVIFYKVEYMHNRNSLS